MLLEQTLCTPRYHLKATLENNKDQQEESVKE